MKVLRRIALAGILLALAGQAMAAGFTRESFVVELRELAFGVRPVPVELWIPDTGKASYPLVIAQHGSTLDGYRFEGGKGRTDTYSSRMMQAAVARGFAVAVLDAFYGKNLAPSDKTQFPNAGAYAVRLRAHLLAKESRLDPRNTFYTGFSYGGDTALGQLASRNPTPWAAVVAAEAGCNTFFKPRPLPYPVLIMKGTESHYYPRACQIAAEENRKIGNRVEVLLFEKANHYFSHNGQIVRGLAFNGCTDNPAIHDDATGTWTFYDGTPTTRDEINRRCFRNEGGKGQTYEKMDEAVSKALDFFTQNLRP